MSNDGHCRSITPGREAGGQNGRRGRKSYDKQVKGRRGEGKETVMISLLGSVHQTSQHRLTGTASGRAFMDVIDI